VSKSLGESALAGAERVRKILDASEGKVVTLWATRHVTEATRFTITLHKVTTE
jgi:hypothetical protein